MVEKIGDYGRGLKPPSYLEARVTYLKREVNNVTLLLEKYKKGVDEKWMYFDVGWVVI